MTYPRVTVRGESLPEPDTGWDDREYSDGETAVYYPSRFKVNDSFLYLVWETDDDSIFQMWIKTDRIASIVSTYEGDE